VPVLARETIYVLAFSRREFRQWAQEHRSAHGRFEYTHMSSQLEGARQRGKYIALDGWGDRRNAAALGQMIHARELSKVEHDGIADTITVIHMPVYVMGDYLSTQIMQMFNVTPEQIGLPVTRQCPCFWCTRFREQGLPHPADQLADVIGAMPQHMRELTERVQSALVSVEDDLRRAGSAYQGFSVVAQTPERADWTMRFDLDWPESSYGHTCAHVCGGDGHSCDTLATEDMTYVLPSGGKRTLPLCATCYDAERRMILDEEGR
jgi:hypothetical protein